MRLCLVPAQAETPTHGDRRLKPVTRRCSQRPRWPLVAAFGEIGRTRAGPLADLELVLLAMPRRVFTFSQVNHAIDRLVDKFREDFGLITFEGVEAG